MSAPKLEPPPPTPATEWADQAHAALAPAVTVDTAVFDTSSQPPLMTPGLDIPGAYPGDDDALYPQAARPALGRASSGGAKDAIHTSGYIAPERLDQVEHLVEGVGHTAARFVPTGVASAVSSYWCEWKPSQSLPRLAVAIPTPADVACAVDRRAEKSCAWRTLGWSIVLAHWLLQGGGRSFVLCPAHSLIFVSLLNLI